MKKIIIKISKETKQVDLPKNFFAVNGENLQSKLVFEFIDEFVDGQARIEYKPKFGSKMYQMLNKENNTYTIPLKSALTGTSHIDLNLVITEGTNENEIPKFVSKMFYFNIDPAVNAEIEQPDEYPTWIEIANTKLNAMDQALEQVDNLDIDASKSGTVATVTIIKKDGTQESVEINDGEQGIPGPANVLSIGTVTKGEEAEATITGESPSQVLNLVLPKGDKGDKGDKGEKGDKGDCNFATFEVNEYMELVMNKTEDMLLTFNLNENGFLEVVI